MDLHQSTIDFFSTLPVMQSWPELQVLLTRKAFTKPKYWELPVKACQAVGGAIEQAIPAVTAVACAQTSIMLIDDMLDEDPRGQYHCDGHAKTANYAAAFQAAAFEALYINKLPPVIQLPGLHSLNRMILVIALGQHLDIHNPADESAYWYIVENKSAPFFGAALYLGALTGGASHKVANELDQLGRLYGEMIQIHDDLNDTMATPANPDWIQKRLPLPILFARLVDHPARVKFLELCQDIAQPQALADAQGILLRCGAVSYCVDQLLRRHQKAQAVLDTIPLTHREPLDELLDEVVAPVYRLFQETGLPQPANLVTTYHLSA